MFCRENQHRPKSFSAGATMTSAMRKRPKRPRFHSLGKQAARPDGPLGLSYSETRLFIWRPPDEESSFRVGEPKGTIRKLDSSSGGRPLRLARLWWPGHRRAAAR